MEIEDNPHIGDAADRPTSSLQSTSGRLGIPLEVSYDFILRTFIPLNHDRFKSYFNYFLILHVGLLTLIFVRGTESIISAADRQLFTLAFAVLGVLSSLVWFAVLIKVARDIRLAWKSAIYVEEVVQSPLTLAKDFVNGSPMFESWYFSVWRLLPASVVMTLFPLVFLAIYGLVIATVD